MQLDVMCSGSLGVVSSSQYSGNFRSSAFAALRADNVFLYFIPTKSWNFEKMRLRCSSVCLFAALRFA